MGHLVNLALGTRAAASRRREARAKRGAHPRFLVKLSEALFRALEAEFRLFKI